jgi:hypothetical protein
MRQTCGWPVGCVTAPGVSKRIAETPSQADGCDSFTHVASSGSAISNGVRMAQKSSDVPWVDGRRLQHYI